MTRPPQPTSAEYEKALHGIHQRHRAAGDDHPLVLSEDPREVHTYLRRRGFSRLLTDKTGDDIIDALTLRLWLQSEGDATELWLLEAAEHLGRNRRTIGRVLSLDSGQGVVDRIKRHRTVLGRSSPAAESVEPSSRDAEIRALAVDLVACSAGMPADIADDLPLGVIVDRLEHWPAGEPPRAGVLSALRLLLGDLAAVAEQGTRLRAVVDGGAELLGTVLANRPS